MPSVSVIIPCYNRANLIKETIKNMLEQTVSPMEVIVVDDGSSDGSPDVVSSFGSKVTLIRQTNQGPGAARNAGLKAAKGDFIQFMDSDDLASLNKLEVQVKALQETGADFAYGPWVRCHIKDNHIAFVTSILQGAPVPASKRMLEWFVSGWSLVFQNCLFRRSILLQTGWYRTDLMPSEDSEYFIRILLANAKPVYTPGVLVFYREFNADKITSGGTSADRRACDWTNFLEITGGYLSRQVPEMKRSTKIALAASVQSHLKYCKQNNLPVLSIDHPYYKIIQSWRLHAFIYSYYLKIRRKLLGNAWHYTPFNCRRPDYSHEILVCKAGYKFLNVYETE